MVRNVSIQDEACIFLTFPFADSASQKRRLDEGSVERMSRGCREDRPKELMRTRTYANLKN